MGFGTIAFTSRGRALQSKATAGAELHFNRISIGDGQLSGQAVEELPSLIHEVKSLDINELRILSGNKAKIGGVLSNQGLVSGFYWRELGVYAQDPDLGEILYCYGNAGALAEYIPPQGGSEILEKQVNVIAIVGNSSNITATIDQSLVYASKQELNEKISHSLAAAAGDFLVASKAGQFVKKTIAEIKTLLGLGSAAYTDSTAYAASNHNHDSAYASKTEFGSHLSDTTAHGINNKVDVTTYNSHVAEVATISKSGHVQLYNGTDSSSTSLAATAASVKSAMDKANSAFQFANDGKTAIANAVTAKGVSASPADTFPVLANKIGQINTGKKWASGGVSVPSSSILSFYNVGGGASDQPYASVSGLTFKPSFILLKVMSGPYTYETIYEELGGDYPKSVKTFVANSTFVSSTNSHYRGDAGNASVTSTGFTLPVGVAGTYIWIAFE